MERGLRARVHYTTFPNSNCLFLMNGGHGQGFFDPGNLPEPAGLYFNIAGIDKLAKRVAAAGCDVLLSSMPVQGENRYFAPAVGLDPDAVHATGAHDTIGTSASFTPTNGSPLQYFLTPALAALDWVLSQRSYAKVVVGGISGGGWTTTMLAALEPRITHSYAIVGSVPLPYRDKPREGDWEQYAVPFDYLDLYAMAVAEPGRKAWLLYNANDPCCFQAAKVVPWAARFSEFIRVNFGRNRLRIIVDANSMNHDLSELEASRIIDDLTR
jgi:pimeloyl-ACP methyl ester carboxylesterase